MLWALCGPGGMKLAVHKVRRPSRYALAVSLLAVGNWTLLLCPIGWYTFAHGSQGDAPAAQAVERSVC
jgi:hypothetical protein